MRSLPPLLVLLVVACGGGAGPEASSPSTKCETARCLEDIARVVKQHRAEARACYDEGHKRDPSLRGRVVIKFKVDADGRVVEASQGFQEPQITDAEVVACITAVIQRIQFAKIPSGTTSAYHDFEFSPR